MNVDQEASRLPRKNKTFPLLQTATAMESIPEIHIFRAQHCHVSAMAHIFVDSFDLDGSVKLMYTKDEIWPVIKDILHDYMDDASVEFKLAMTRDSGLIVGWMSFGVIPASGPVPQFAFNELTSWATQRLLRGSVSSPRYHLAVQLETRSRQAQVQHMPSNRLVINALVTEPAYRRLRIADTLLKCAVDRARSADWSVWAQTPTVYEGLFWRNGFHDVGGFGLDLNVFKPAEEVAMGIHGRQLGVQTWRQMKLDTRAESFLNSVTAETVAEGSPHG